MRRHGILVPLACALALISTVAFAMSPPIVTKTGIDVLRERGFDILRGKRVGLITNPTGLTSDLQSTIDILFRAEGVQLTALYGPEHGVRGDAEAGKYIDTYVDKATGLPVYSLYGKTRKPTKEMLSGIDVLVYDIQDIGVLPLGRIHVVRRSVAQAFGPLQDYPKEEFGHGVGPGL